MDYISCKKLAIENKIKSASNWFRFVKENKNISLPYHPQRKFKSEWKSWLDFLDKKDLRIYKVNDDFFKKINRNSAYILGFWAADGHIRKNQFSITQSKKDKYLLEKILDIMSSDNKLNIHNINNIYFNLHSDEIVSDVIRIFGEYESKTFDLNFPNIEEKYIPDFIRGYFDGDGCICFQKNEKCYVSSMVSASRKLITGVYNFLKKNKDFNGKLKKYNSNYIISMGVNDTRRFGKLIYNDLTDDVLYLKRKKEKFDISGDIKIASFNKEFIPYKEAKEYIKNLKIITFRGWKKFKKENNIEFIPSNVSKYTEYKNWKDFIS
jgi:hypothetical protein